MTITFKNNRSANAVNYYLKVVCRTTLIFGLIVLAPFSSSITAQDKMNEIDEIFNWTNPESPGCVCAVSQHGKMIVHKAYGSADLERNVPLDTNSVFDAGSVVKQFVATAILLLVEEGKLSLTEDIHSYIPELPDYGDKITLDHLLTHTSGIRDWTGIKNISNEDTDALTMVLRQKALNFAPGEEWAYSNSGYVLLKEIIARTTGMSFGDFARNRLFDPLQMNSTAYQHDLRVLTENRALAYEKHGDQWKLEMLFDNDRGGGGALLSTPSDLLIWSDAIANAHFVQFVREKLQEPAALNNGRKLGYGRGLFLDRNHTGEFFWHGGGSAGYQTILAYFPGPDISVAVMCNAGELNQAAFAGRIVRLVVPEINTDDPKANDTSDRAEVSELELKEKEGIYLNENGQSLRVMSKGNRIRIAGGSELIPINNDHFRAAEGNLAFMSQDEFEIHFLSNDEFEWKSMEGETKRYKRANPPVPDLEKLKAFEGKYKSEDVPTTINVKLENERLVIHLDHSPEQKFEFNQLDSETFQWRMLMVRFDKDNSDKITALNLTTPLLKNVKFTKLQQ